MEGYSGERNRRHRRNVQHNHLLQEDLETRRQSANQMERRRMLQLNLALDRLRSILPAPKACFKSSKPRKLSKINTLRQAMEHIRKLENILNDRVCQTNETSMDYTIPSSTYYHGYSTYHPTLYSIDRNCSFSTTAVEDSPRDLWQVSSHDDQISTKQTHYIYKK